HSNLQFEHFGNGKCLSLPAPEWRWWRDPGRKQPHFFDPPQRLALIGDIQRTLGLQSAGIHSLITITGHNNLVSGPASRCSCSCWFGQCPDGFVTPPICLQSSVARV